jgi:hypothetical protein
MITASNIHYDIADKTQAVHCAGIGAIHMMFLRLGLQALINAQVRVFKRRMPYSESDHVLNIAFNILTGGENIEDIELLRNNETYLKALAAECIPDPTTAGDFLRRFDALKIDALMNVFNEVRLKVWAEQPSEFFEHAVIEADGSICGTDGECKKGMDISYDGQWGYHPLLVSLANTAEPLFIVNRPANRPSDEGVDEYFDRAIALARRAGFRKVSARGDTAFAHTGKFDGWDADGVRFAFGFDVMPNIKAIINALPAAGWKPLERPAKYAVKTEPRERPDNVKDEVVARRGYEHIRLDGEETAEFDYRPGKCGKKYRVVVVKKNLSMSKGCDEQREFWDDVRYFCYITNERKWTQAEVVLFANDRCDQENLIAQLKGGVKALRAPSNTLESNWAYMVIASLAWSAKAWFALLQPQSETKRPLLRMEFKKFLNNVLLLPCQIIHQGKKLIYRLLNWNPWTETLLRGMDAIRGLCLN